MTVDTSSESQSPDRKLQEDGVSTWDHDPRNPYNWPTWRKWLTMCISYWVTILVGINATSFTTPAETLSAEFNVDNSFFEFSFFAVTSWNFTAAVVPLATLPMMETFGFRVGYTVCPIATPNKCSDANETRGRLSCSSSSSSRSAWHKTTRRLWSPVSLRVLLAALSRMLLMVLPRISSSRHKSGSCH